MATIELMGHINAAGKLELELPAGLPVGEVHVTLELTVEDVPWTQQELDELLRPVKPMTGREMFEAGLLGGWGELGITDSVAWLEEQRKKHERKLNW